MRYWATPAYRWGDARYDNVVILRQNEDLLTAPAALLCLFAHSTAVRGMMRTLRSHMQHIWAHIQVAHATHMGAHSGRTCIFI